MALLHLRKFEALICLVNHLRCGRFLLKLVGLLNHVFRNLLGELLFLDHLLRLVLRRVVNIESSTGTYQIDIAASLVLLVFFNLSIVRISLHLIL